MLSLRPSHVSDHVIETHTETDSLNALGRAALADGAIERAIAIFGQAILGAPLDPHVHVNMAAAYLAAGQLGAAEGHARRAVKLAPTMAEAHHNLGNALFAAGDADGALAAFAAARALDPDEEAHWTNFLFTQPFADHVDGPAISAENRAWGLRIETEIAQRDGVPVRLRITDADPERRLRLAYVLPEVDAHVTARFLAPVLAAHDRDRFEISLYGHRTNGGGSAPALLMAPGVRWIDTFGRSPGEIAAALRADHIDVLIHPCTFKARYRIVLAHRAAPLQMAGINFVSTTGLAATDYLLSDAMLTPPGPAAAQFSEKVMRLASFNCYGVPHAAPPVAPLPASTAGFVRFGSFNNPAKLGQQAVATWAAVLRRVPTSRLLLKHGAFDDADVRAAFAARFSAEGVAADRLDFAGFTAEPDDYLAAYHGVDIALDAMPFNGGTTSYEAIWMGVPVLTLAGDILMARQTASLMAAIGHAEFVTESKEAFVNKAFALSQEIGRLADIRAGLRAAAAATIFNGPRYTRMLEDAVRSAWRDLCRTEVAGPRA
jgi:predicted O-linked N-acetylglucosamine transferase (SPINDLY family)